MHSVHCLSKSETTVYCILCPGKYLVCLTFFTQIFTKSSENNNIFSNNFNVKSSLELVFRPIYTFVVTKINRLLIIYFRNCAMCLFALYIVDFIFVHCFSFHLLLIIEKRKVKRVITTKRSTKGNTMRKRVIKRSITMIPGEIFTFRIYN